MLKETSSQIRIALKWYGWIGFVRLDHQQQYQRDIFWIFSSYVLYSTLLHLPPLRFYCVGGYWDRTQDCFDFGIDSQQTPKSQGLISSTFRLDLIHCSARSHPQSARSHSPARLDLIHNSARSHPQSARSHPQQCCKVCKKNMLLNWSLELKVITCFDKKVF